MKTTDKNTKEALTLIDASMPATVNRWLDTWFTPSEWLCKSLQVAYEGNGLLSTWDATTSTYVQHKDRAELVEYVVAWARNSKN